jgi:dTDP-glucose pyrophosphorylase
VQIIIPMSGFGERFRRAGYAVPKPLIEIDGKPIIGHVIDLFPGEHDFIFICNEDHLNEPAYRMADILQQHCPTGQIVGIAAHKLGPIHAVRQVAHLIKPDSPVVVNYCDFTCLWDWSDFKAFVTETACDGAIPAYKGFHPHTLGTTNYAYMREHNGWVQDIQEKQPYTNNRMEEYASSGTYYFRSGALMLEAFDATMTQSLNVGGEYYVSLSYKPLLADNKSVAVYPLQHFMQWGTPADVIEYEGWSAAFRALLQDDAPTTKPEGTLILPMAGLGQRFAKEGYTQTKPLIPVSGLPMVIQASNDLPNTQRQVFVLRSDMPGYQDITATLKAHYPNGLVHEVPAVTEGQACTALIGLEAAQAAWAHIDEPITFGACDNGALYDRKALSTLLADPSVDVVVWGARGHANAVRAPQMFGWIDANEQGRVTKVSVKMPLAHPDSDPIVIATFTFRHADDFKRCLAQLQAQNGRINGEFYLDSCINVAIELGLNCQLFEVDHFLSWGTPNDLKTFEYWQSCFHQWHGHPYRLEQDHRVPSDAVSSLATRYQSFSVARPGPRS